MSVESFDGPARDFGPPRSWFHVSALRPLSSKRSRRNFRGCRSPRRLDRGRAVPGGRCRLRDASDHQSADGNARSWHAHRRSFPFAVPRELDPAETEYLAIPAPATVRRKFSRFLSSGRRRQLSELSAVSVRWDHSGYYTACCRAIYPLVSIRRGNRRNLAIRHNPPTRTHDSPGNRARSTGSGGAARLCSLPPRRTPMTRRSRPAEVRRLPTTQSPYRIL